jgi:hypothetical protein
MESSDPDRFHFRPGPALRALGAWRSIGCGTIVRSNRQQILYGNAAPCWQDASADIKCEHEIPSRLALKARPSSPLDLNNWLHRDLGGLGTQR